MKGISFDLFSNNFFNNFTIESNQFEDILGWARLTKIHPVCWSIQGARRPHPDPSQLVLVSKEGINPLP